MLFADYQLLSANNIFQKQFSLSMKNQIRNLSPKYYFVYEAGKILLKVKKSFKSSSLDY